MRRNTYVKEITVIHLFRRKISIVLLERHRSDRHRGLLEKPLPKWNWDLGKLAFPKKNETIRRRRWVHLNILMATIHQQMVLQYIARVHASRSLLLHSLAVLFRRTHGHDPPLCFKDGPIEGTHEGHELLNG